MGARAKQPKTFYEARNRYGHNPELFWWVFMRISGFLLIFLVFAHVFINNILVDAGTIDYDYVASRLTQPTVKVFDSFLLGLALMHGANGLRFSIEDYVRNPRRRFWVKAIVFTLFGAVFVAGVMTLWAYSFDEMGTAIRNLGE